jgi:ATP-dependent DNA helicase RecQ
MHIVHYIPARKTPFIAYTQSREELRYVRIPSVVYEERKRRLTERIESIIAYGSSRTMCRSRMLLSYFGEKEAGDCEQCDVCLSKKKRDANLTYQQISDWAMSKIQDIPLQIKLLIKENPFPEEQVLEVIRDLTDQGKLQIEGTKIKKTGQS